MKKNQTNLLHVFIMLSITLLLSFCSSTEGNVKFAGESLTKAKNNQGPELAQSDYTDADNAYQSAQKFLKEDKSADADKMAGTSVQKSRLSILSAKDIRAKKSIDDADSMIQKITQKDTRDVSLEQDKDQNLGDDAQTKLELVQKIKPAQTLLDEAKKAYQDGQNLAPKVKEKIGSFENIKEEDSYIEKMNEAYEKAQKAKADLKTEYHNHLVKRGELLKSQIMSDPYYNNYPGEKKKALDDFESFKTAVKDNDAAGAEEKEQGYYNLEALLNKKGSMTQSAGSSVQENSSFFSADALEKVKILIELKK